MTYSDVLREKARETSSIVCVGLDPLIENIPVNVKDTEKKISKFFLDMLDAMVSEKTLPP